MSDKVKLSDSSMIERAKLPQNVRDDLDQFFEELLDEPVVSGRNRTGTMDGVSLDGSRFYIEFIYEYHEEAGELLIDTIQFFSY